MNGYFEIHILVTEIEYDISIYPEGHNYIRTNLLKTSKEEGETLTIYMVKHV